MRLGYWLESHKYFNLGFHGRKANLEVESDEEVVIDKELDIEETEVVELMKYKSARFVEK